MENQILESLAGKENINLLDYNFLANHLPNMNIHHFHIDYNAPCLNFSCDYCKGRYTRGVLLPEHDPGSFCTCQCTRGNVKYRGVFCRVEILHPRIKYIRGIVGTHGGTLLPERAPGACSGSKIPRVYRP